MTTIPQIITITGIEISITNGRQCTVQAGNIDSKTPANKCSILDFNRIEEKGYIYHFSSIL